MNRDDRAEEAVCETCSKIRPEGEEYFCSDECAAAYLEFWE